MSNTNALGDSQRKLGQRNAVRSQAFAAMISNVIAGNYMMLYANDVLGLSAQKIAIIFSLTPLVTVLRLPVVPYVQRFGLIRTLIYSRAGQGVIIATLLAMPASWVNGALLAALVISFLVFQEFGLATVWQPLMRHITTDMDRGGFYGRMRSIFTIVNLILSGAIALLVSDTLQEFQYKIILAVCIIGTFNSIFWVRSIPEPFIDRDANLPKVRDTIANMWKLLRTSPLFRWPLIIIFIVSIGETPIAIVYFREALHTPANLLGAMIFFDTLGKVISLILWGKVSDTLGFRPMLVGLLILSSILSLILWVIQPFPPQESNLLELISQNQLGTLALLIFGFGNGVLGAGLGIGTISLMQYHVTSKNSMSALNLFALFQVSCQALATFSVGFLLHQVVIPQGASASDSAGSLHFDFFKLYRSGLLPLLMIAAIPIALRLPNIRPWFGVADFFSALRYAPWRSLILPRQVYHEREELRIELARNLGDSPNPLNIPPLIELLRDPSYDVKVEAIRSLSYTRSDLAGDKLMEILNDNERRSLWGHATRALGELKHRPAVPLLTKRLSPDNPVRAIAHAARSLGKIGERSAAKPIFECLNRHGQPLHVVSSCCWALLKLDMHEYAETTFRVVGKLRLREERYELFSILARWIGITDRWLLISNSQVSTWQSLNEYLSDSPILHHIDMQAILDAFRDKRHRQIMQLVDDRLSTPGEMRQDLIISMRKVLGETDEWSPLFVLATAWLLFSKKNINHSD